MSVLGRNPLKSMSVQTRLRLVLMSGAVGILVVSVMFYRTLESSAVHSPAYNRIIQAKDVISNQSRVQWKQRPSSELPTSVTLA